MKLTESKLKQLIREELDKMATNVDEVISKEQEKSELESKLRSLRELKQSVQKIIDDNRTNTYDLAKDMVKFARKKIKDIDNAIRDTERKLRKIQILRLIQKNKYDR